MKLKYKALITDFDGTLVGLDFAPSLKVKEAVKKLLDNGFKVCIATGRTYWGTTEKVCQELNLKDPQIASAGGQIIDPTSGEIIWESYLDYESAKNIIEYLINNNHPFAAESGKYVFSDNPQVEEGYGLGISFKNIKELDFKKVVKVFVPDMSLENTLRELFPDLNVIVAGLAIKHVLDITYKNVSKEAGAKQLSKILNIDLSEVVGLGDGYNDIPLISVCGFKVAMANAPIELKEMADLIVPDVEHEGLVTLIDTIYNMQ